MMIIRETGKPGAEFATLPSWVKKLIHHSSVIPHPYPHPIRLSDREVNGKRYYCFEDNVRMLRILIRLRDEVVESLYFNMDAPKKTSAVRPVWQYVAMKEFALKDDDGLRNAMFDFIANGTSIYPLADSLRIRVTDDTSAIHTPKGYFSDDPLYYCGKVVDILEEMDDGKKVVVEGLVGGEPTVIPLTIMNGKYYGKSPHPGDWIIAKQGYLTVVVSKRELTRYYLYISNQP